MKKTRIMITSRSYMIGLTPNEPKHNLKDVGQMFIHMYGCWSCSQKSVGHVTWKNEKGVSTIQIKTNGKAKKINPFFLFFSFFSLLFFKILFCVYAWKQNFDKYVVSVISLENYCNPLCLLRKGSFLIPI